MTARRSDRGPGILIAALLGLAVLGAIGLRLGLARDTGHPGHADEASYPGLAPNLVGGRGFEID